MAATQTGRIAGWTIGIILGLLILAALIGLAIIRSGIINIAATERDPALVHWVLKTASENSIERHARGIAVPPLDDPAMVRKGTSHYRAMCEKCHGGPGAESEELAEGLNPHPPKLDDVADEWKPNELFWVTKHGIRMTGMPAWGPTHSDEEIWAMVAFLQQYPSISPADYRKVAPEEEDE
ncbi:MAG: c-type cytochrome [Armatimonadota bacterium]